MNASSIAKILILSLVTSSAIAKGDKTLTPGSCVEVMFSNNIIFDNAISLYHQRNEQWAPRTMPTIYACRRKDIQELKPEAEGIYVSGLIFVAIESGILDNKEEGWSFIIHELVHHLQYLDGKVAMVDAGEIKECELENEAYKIQRQYLDAIGSEWTIEEKDECIVAN